MRSALLFLLLVTGVFTTAAAAEPPNVVVILADDLGFSDLGCYGGEIETPTLDRLAAGGVRFTQGYNTARCWPTRAALLTGYYAQAVRRDASPGIEGGNVGHSRPAWARLLPDLLVSAGYRCYHSGKWHIDGDPRQQGFLHSMQIEGGQNDYFDPEGITVDGKPVQAGEGFYVTTAIGDHAAACLRDHAANHGGTPFFSYVAFTSPHFPLHAPQEVIATYKDRYLAGWDKVRAARFERLTASQIVTASLAPLEPQVGPPYQPQPHVLARFGAGEIDRPLPWADLTPEQREFQATKMAIHAAMVELMDRAVGRIVEQLEAMNALDDTLIVFLSDNGASAEILIRGKGHAPALPLGAAGTYPCLGPGWSSCANTPFRRHKTWVHEGGIATPWIVHWPKGIATKNTLRTQPVHVIDVVPTVLALAGVAPPSELDGKPVPPMQGRSFAACLADPAALPPHETLWWCHEGNRAVRVGDWKLVAAKGDPWELYDLASDRTETMNLAAAQPERVATLEKVWIAGNKQCRQLAAPDGTHGQPSGRQAAAPQAAAARPAKASLAARRPNIIYVITDDQGYGDIASHGNPILKTPHLDRLRDESVRLTEYHVSPTCAPTRAALLTGRHEFRSGITHTILERERLAPAATTLPQLLASAGYTSGIFGKWHLGDEDDYQPGKRGFDRVFIHGAGGIGQSYPGSCGDVPGNAYTNPIIRSDGEFVQTKGYCTDVFFREAESWIEACQKEKKPFFCYIATNAPHSPYDPPPGGREQTYRESLAAAGVKNAKQLTDTASFFAMIENIDANMGRLMAKLDEWGIADDTLLVFTTDNGTAAGAHVFNDGMRGTKGTPYRGGTRVPAFWRWKGMLPEGVDVPAVTAHIDVLPTLCEITGATIPPVVAEKVEGRSLVPLLTDAAADWPDRPLITHVGRWERGQAAESRYQNCRIREGRWSLVNTKNRPDAWELYDIASDPAEKHDLAAAQPDVVKRLAATYDAWWKSVQPDLVNENVDGPAENPFQTAYWAQFGPRPTLIDVPYGDHPKQKLHFWKSPHAQAGEPAPLLFFIHGGGWQGGNRMSGLTPILKPVLDAGISVASVEYRFIAEAMHEGIEPPVKAPLSDAARALQTVRSKAAEWGIDKERIVAAGGSAGACSSLWLAFHDDMADPASADPIARESTRLLAAAVSGAQTTLDPRQMKEWTPNSRYGGHAFGFMPSPEQRDSQFAQFLAARDKILPWIEQYSPYALVTADDPPVALFYNTPPALGQEEQDPTHTANFGVKLKERLDEVGVPCELVYPGAQDVKHATLQEAVIGFLQPAAQPTAAPTGATLRSKRPNILYIIADDQSPFDFRFYNPTSTLRAPAIERLAAEGMVFDAAYHMGSFSGAVCTPSRHMVMCGRGVWRLPIGPKAAACPPDIAQFTMAPLFNAAGYDTMRTCKQGNAYEAADALFTVRRDATSRGGTAETGSAWHGDRVMEYLAERERTKDTDPFLIYFGFSHPHDTRDGTPDLLATYGATNHADQAVPPPADPKQPPLPASWLPQHPFDHGHMNVRDEVAVSGVWGRRDEATIRNELGREYACSENIDRQIGRVLDKLAAMGELENTWIFYTADHGMAIGRHGLQGKQNLYEHTWRVPFIVKGPGVKPGSRVPGNIYLGDSLATLCDIAGIPCPDTNEGTSFLPVLEGRQETVRDVLYGVYCGGQKPGIRSVRQGDWKLIKYESPSGGLHTQLFNLRDNPHEFLAEHHDPAVTGVSRIVPTAGQRNLADDPAFAATRAEMEALLWAEMERHDDPFRFSDQAPPASPPTAGRPAAARGARGR